MQIKNSRHTWGWMSILIHWLTAVGVAGMFMLGLWMVDLTYYHSWYHQAPQLHKSIGVLLFMLTCWRLVWMLSNIKPMALETHTRSEQKLARIAHSLLYILLLAVMFSGYLISTADGRPLEVFSWFSIPAILYGFPGQEDTAGTIHLFLAVLLVFMAVVHALAAIKHHVLDKDKTLKRMLGRT